MHSQSTTQGKRLAIAARVSTEEQEEHGYSLDDQVDKGRHLAALYGYTVDERHIYCGEEGGTLPLVQRPIMSRLLTAARAREFDAVCFTKIDRMSRRLKYMLELWDAFDAAGVTVHVIQESIDTSTPTGRLLRNVLGSIAEFERDTIAERTLTGRKRKLMRGELYLSAPMDGYTYTKGDKKAGAPGSVTIHPERAPIVRRMFERRAQGLSWQRIAMELTADRVPTLKGKAAWSPDSVRSVVHNPAYKGEGQYGRRRSMHTEHNRRRIRWITDGAQLITLKYPAIVTPELWADANTSRTAALHPVRTSVDNYLLRGGMVRCAEHNLIMSASTGGHGVRRYRCKRLGPDSRPRLHSIAGPALDAAVWNDVMAFLADPARGLAQARRLAEEAAAQVADIDAQLEALQRRHAALDQEAAELLRQARRGKIRQDWLDASMDEVMAEQGRINGEIAVLEAQRTLTTEDLPRADRVMEVCQQLARGAHYATPTERRELLDLLRVQVMVTDNAYTITGAVPDMAIHGDMGVLAGVSTARHTPPPTTSR